MVQQRLRIIVLYAVLLTLFGFFLSGLRPARTHVQRGIWFPDAPVHPLPATFTTPLGTTADLTQYESDADLTQALTTMRDMGITWVRQEIAWDAVEATEGEYTWDSYDRVLNAAVAEGLAVVVVLNRTPDWARQPNEQENPLAPPLDTAPFVRFAEAAAARYGAQVWAWQVWDEPNLMPHWGTEVIIDPATYTDFLAQTAPALRAQDPDALIVTAGLAPTGEPGGFNMSEMRFLEGLYAAGAAEHFDAVALKPYGFWTAANERLYNEGTLNFDRPVLVREVMEANDDSATPIWFVEGGWATLPSDWQGDPPPWGSDSAETQQMRLTQALTRTTLEWQWVQAIALQPFHPNVAPTNPQTGLALVDDGGQRTALGATTAQFAQDFYGGGASGAAVRAEWETVQRPALQRWDYVLWLTLGTIAALAVRMAWHLLWLPWRTWGALFRRQPDALQIAIFAATVLLFYHIDPLVLSLVLYGAIGILIAWQLRLGLAGVAFALPFFLQVKTLGSLQFSLVELLLVWCAVVWGAGIVVQAYQRVATHNDSASLSLRDRLGTFFQGLRLFFPQDALDWVIALFVLWAALSLPLSEAFGVASREFRVVVLGSALYYWLLRRQSDSNTLARWVMGALVAGGVIVSLYGLYQWLFTTDIITAEGVRRIKGTYGSPNNLALFLERLIPIALALWLLVPAAQSEGATPRTGARWYQRLTWQQWGYALALLPIAACLFLTFSRGALLLGLPVGLAWVAWWGGKRTRQVIMAVGVVGILALIPFAATERIASAVNVEGGTWFIRMKLWEATAMMIQEHPLVGVGLDNFLYTYEQYRLPEAWREPDLSHPHQIVLHFWVALGIPGLLFLLAQQFTFWRGWWATVHTPPSAWHRAMLIGLGGSMAATVAHGMIDNSYFLVDLGFVWMLTLALSVPLRKTATI